MAGLKLMAELGLDGSGFETGMHKAKQAAHGMLEGMKGFIVGAIGVTTVEQAIAKTVETAKELVETSKRLAVAPEQLQILRRASLDAGVELQDLAGFFEKVDIAREKALGGGPEGLNLTKTFGSLGISRQALQSQTAAQLFMGPMSNTVKNRNPEELGAIFRELGIKGFGPMIAVLKTDFGELGQKMHHFGAIMDTETAVQLKTLSEEFSFLGQIITSQLGPAMLWLVEKIYTAGGKIANKSAQLGAGTAKFGVGDWIKWGVTGGLANSLLGIKSPLNKFDWNAASAAGGAAETNWMGPLRDFQKRMAAEADKLKHPVAPDFSKSSLPMKLSAKAMMIVPDSLTRVGNFLGSRGLERATRSIEEKQLSTLEKIAALLAGLTLTGMGGAPALPAGAAVSAMLQNIHWAHP